MGHCSITRRSFDSLHSMVIVTNYYRIFLTRVPHALIRHVVVWQHAASRVILEHQRTRAPRLLAIMQIVTRRGYPSVWHRCYWALLYLLYISSESSNPDCKSYLVRVSWVYISLQAMCNHQFLSLPLSSCPIPRSRYHKPHHVFSVIQWASATPPDLRAVQ